MARARTGSVEAFTAADGSIYYKARIRLADGSRVRVDIPSKHAGDEQSRARYALARQQLEDEKGAELKKRERAAAKHAAALAPRANETVARWLVDRYVPAYEANGKESRDVVYAFRGWVLPTIGSRPIGALTIDHARAVRAGLRDGVAAGKIKTKRACDLWSIFVTAMGRAFTDDDPSYEAAKVADASKNPCAALKPPYTGEQIAESERERQWLRPREFDKLMRCDAVPVEWRRLHAIACGLYLRPEELYALRWADVDLEALEVSVTKTMDLKTGVVTPGTKTGADRAVPIVPMLVPLLKRMHKEAGGQGLVVPLATRVRDVEKNAAMTRRHLEAAGIARGELREGTSKRMPFDFRSWRTTGCTWHAMAGADSWALARWAGHKSPETTWHSYAKEGPDLRKRYGEPFPALPSEVVDGGSRAGGNGPSLGQVAAVVNETLKNPYDASCEGRDLNPHGVTR